MEVKGTVDKKEVIKDMEDYFGDDSRRIEHAKRVTEYAQEIMAEEGGDYEVVIAAGLLHDIGIHEAERKYGSCAGPYQEKEGPPIARKILRRLGVKEKIIKEICAIIGSHHSPGKIDSINFKIIWDADWLVNLKDEYDCSNKKKLARVIEKIFLTMTGKNLARKTYL